MAGVVIPDRETSVSYKGLPAIFEYTNEDGELFLRNCGQAAAATLLTCHGKLSADEDRAVGQMARLELDHPPDNFGGLFGTSRRRVERACRDHGMPLREVVGETALRLELARRNPVAVMLGVPSGRLFGLNLPGGHWLVVYGFDADYVYVTNWADGRMPWAEFRKRWRSWVSLLIRMRGRGLVADRA